MDEFESYTEEYIHLITSAFCYSELLGNNVIHIKYNGFEIVELYKTKLNSLVPYVNLENKLQRSLKGEEQVLHFEVKSLGNLGRRLSTLLDCFIISDTSLEHRNLNVYPDSNASDSKDFQAFINVAYENAAEFLKNDSTANEHTLREVIVGNEKTQEANLKLIRNALVDLGVTDELMNYQLGPRDISRIAAIIDVLKEKDILKKNSDDILITAMFGFVKYPKKHPTKIGRTTSKVINKYENQKAALKKYLSQKYNIN